jgi:hypothetical protein
VVSWSRAKEKVDLKIGLMNQELGFGFVTPRFSAPNIVRLFFFIRNERINKTFINSSHRLLLTK